MINGTVEAVKLIEHINDGLDYCEITIEFDVLKIFGNYNEIMSYMGKRVQYTVRQDMYKNEQVLVVANMADMFTVQTLKEEENIRLIPENEATRAVCNFTVHGVRPGDYEADCIGFLAGWARGKSDKTSWIDCTVVDRESRVFTLRKFTNKVEAGVDVEETIESLIGSYIKFDVTFTRFGYQCNEISLHNVPVVLPPEVDIAVSQISKVITDDASLIDYITKYDYINTLKSVIYYEMGYHLVYIAAEIYMINAVCSITNEYNKTTLIRAALTTRGYLLPATAKYSRILLNTDKIRRTALSKDRELMLLLDVFSEEVVSSTKSVYMEISKFVKSILDERRGIKNEESDYVTSFNNLRNIYGGLL